jgi:hypothetical protein
MRMRWLDLLFAHWPVSAEELRPYVPDRLAMDTFDSSAWLGVVPFRMAGVTPRWVPALPGLSAFPELNVRTYVVHHDRPGVWFFSLDAAHALAVRVARAAWRLPYFDADMSVRREREWIEYASSRTHRGAAPAEMRARYRPTGPMARAEPGSLRHWLTERYCLYAGDDRRLLRGEIHHAPWPLQDAELDIERNTMAEPLGIALRDPPADVCFAPELPVVAWRNRVV